MGNYYAVVRSSDYLEHYGILGMKWGVRRFQNPDGSLTEEGRRRYGDILTKDQIKQAVKGYNLKTGSHKKVNRKTIFRTKDGRTYDYKGRRIDADTDVKNPTDDNEKKTSSKKSMKNMTDQELKDANNRMIEEKNYIKNYNDLHPKKVKPGQQMLTNFKDNLVRDLPNVASTALKNYLIDMLKPSANPTRTNTNIDPRTASDEELKDALNRMRNENNYNSMKDKASSSGSSSSDDSWSFGSVERTYNDNDKLQDSILENKASIARAEHLLNHPADLSGARDAYFMSIGDEILRSYGLGEQGPEDDKK